MVIGTDTAEAGSNKKMKKRGRKRDRQLFMMFSIPRVPPEIIVFYGVINQLLPIRMYVGGNSGLLLAFMNQTVHGHHPSDEETMFLNGLLSIGRAGGKAWTLVSIHG
jgi:hypothetical protein